MEIAHCRSLTRIKLEGKQERNVAILLTPETIKRIDLLRLRKEVVQM